MSRLARKWGASLKYEGVTTAAIHPGMQFVTMDLTLLFLTSMIIGWTQTDLGAPLKEWMSKYAPQVPHLTPDAAGAGVIKISEALTLEKTASFWHFDGTNLPW
jgi:hypothetical protein